MSRSETEIVANAVDVEQKLWREHRTPLGSPVVPRGVMRRGELAGKNRAKARKRYAQGPLRSRRRSGGVTEAILGDVRLDVGDDDVSSSGMVLRT